MDAKMRGIVRVVPYDPEWKNEFLKIKAMIVDCVGDLIISVDHVGSTAIEGLASKPILSKIGFEYVENLDVEGKEVFKRIFTDDFMPYNLYVCPKNGKGYLEHIAFRDYLRNHSEVMKTYEELKLELAKQFRTDINGYANAKHDFIQNILDSLSKIN